MTSDSPAITDACVLLSRRDTLPLMLPRLFDLR